MQLLQTIVVVAQSNGTLSWHSETRTLKLKRLKSLWTQYVKPHYTLMTRQRDMFCEVDQ